MATTKDYRDYILEQLNLLDNITCKSMMGEYLLYYNGLLFGGIYDDRLLVNKKKTFRLLFTILYLLKPLLFAIIKYVLRGVVHR